MNIKGEKGMQETQPHRSRPTEKSRFVTCMEKYGLGRLWLRMVNIRMIRFFLVAGLNTVFGWGVYAFFVFIGLHYTIAALVSQIIGILFNFRTYGALVFHNKAFNLLPRFVLVYVITYLCNIGSMTLLKWIFGVNDYVAAAIMCVPIGLLGFVLNKIFVFERIKKDAGPMNPEFRQEP